MPTEKLDMRLLADPNIPGSSFALVLAAVLDFFAVVRGSNELVFLSLPRLRLAPRATPVRDHKQEMSFIWRVSA